MFSLAAHHYTKSDIFDKEKRGFLSSSWIPIAHRSEFISSPYAVERSLFQKSIVIVHEDNQFRAFFNVCRHRAGPLLWENECTSIKALRCKYHGWRYQTDGRLTHTPDFGTATDKEAFSLYPVSIREWCGFLFIRLDEAPQTFDEFIDPIRSLAPKQMKSFQFYRSESHTIRCNWKTYVENYLEGYHIPYLHPSLRASIQQSRYDVRVHENCITHLVPSQNPSVEGFWAYLWPNTAFNLYGTGMSLERILPIDTENICIHYLYLFLPECSESEKEEAIELSRVVTLEDIRICEHVYQNLQSGRYENGPLSPKHEHGVHAFQQWYRQNL